MATDHTFRAMSHDEITEAGKLVEDIVNLKPEEQFRVLNYLVGFIGDNNTVAHAIAYVKSTPDMTRVVGDDN